MIFLKHMLLFIIIPILIITFFILRELYKNIFLKYSYIYGTIIIIILIIAHIISIVYFYLSKKYSIFSLPIGISILTFICYRIPKVHILTGFAKQMDNVDDLFIFWIISIFYFLPISLITLIISIVYTIRN